MCINKETNSSCCCIFSILSAILVGVSISAIFFTGLITSIITLVYITLVVGILALLYVLFTAFYGGKRNCNSLNNSCLATTSIGSIVTSIFALTATSLATFSIPVAILIGVIAFFFISNLFNIVNYIITKLCSSYCKD